MSTSLDSDKPPASQRPGPNGDVENEASAPVPRRRQSAFRNMVEDFGPIWFTWCMNSGILGILTHNLSYQFRGLQQISTVFFLIDLVMFILVSSIFSLRFILFGRAAYDALICDFAQLTLLASWPIAWTTLAAFVSLNVSQSYWGGHWAVLTGYAMWWLGLVWTHTVLIFVIFTITRQRRELSERLPFTIMIPAVGILTDATVGGLISYQAADISPRLSVPVLIVSLMVIGAGLVFALILYATLFHDLFTEGWIAPQLTPTVFVLVGPMGQAATALLQTATSASSSGGNFAAYNRGTFLTAQSAAVVGQVGVFLALLVAGAGTVFLVVALGDVIEKVVARKFPWTPLWNAIIFPSATLVSALSGFAVALDSSAFRVLESIGLVALVCIYCINLVQTVWNVARGKLLFVRREHQD